MRRVTLSLPQRPFLFFCTEHFVTYPTMTRPWGLAIKYHSQDGVAGIWLVSILKWDQTMPEFSASSFLIFLPWWQSEKTEFCLCLIRKISAGNVTDFGFLDRQIFHPVSSSSKKAIWQTDKTVGGLACNQQSVAGGLASGDYKSSKCFVYSSG